MKFSETGGRTPELCCCAGSRGSHTQGAEPFLPCLSFQDELFSILVQRENVKPHLILIAEQEGFCQGLMKMQKCRILNEKPITWHVRTVSLCVCACMRLVYACVCKYMYK